MISKKGGGGYHSMKNTPVSFQQQQKKLKVKLFQQKQ